MSHTKKLSDSDVSALLADLWSTLESKEAETPLAVKQLKLATSVLQAGTLLLLYPEAAKEIIKSQGGAEISLPISADMLIQLQAFGRSFNPPLSVHESISYALGRTLAKAGYFMPPSADESFLDRGQDVSILIPTDLLVRLDALVEEEGYRSRGEALMDALITRLPDETQKK